MAVKSTAEVFCHQCFTSCYITSKTHSSDSASQLDQVPPALGFFLCCLLSPGFVYQKRGQNFRELLAHRSCYLYFCHQKADKLAVNFELWSPWVHNPRSWFLSSGSMCALYHSAALDPTCRLVRINQPSVHYCTGDCNWTAAIFSHLAGGTYDKSQGKNTTQKSFVNKRLFANCQICAVLIKELIISLVFRGEAVDVLIHPKFNRSIIQPHIYSTFVFGYT